MDLQALESNRGSLDHPWGEAEDDMRPLDSEGPRTELLRAGGRGAWVTEEHRPRRRDSDLSVVSFISQRISTPPHTLPEPLPLDIQGPVRPPPMDCGAAGHRP